MLVVRLLRTPVSTSRWVFLPLPRCRNASREFAIHGGKEGILRRTAIIPSLGAPAKAFFGFYEGSLLNIWRAGKSQIIKYRHVLGEYFHLGGARRFPPVLS